MKNPVQFVFFIVIAFTLAMLVPFTKAGLDFVQHSRAHKPQGYELPEFSDFKLTMASALVFAVIEIVMRQVMYKLFVPYCKE